MRKLHCRTSNCRVPVQASSSSNLLRGGQNRGYGKSPIGVQQGQSAGGDMGGGRRPGKNFPFIRRVVTGSHAPSAWLRHRTRNVVCDKLPHDSLFVVQLVAKFCFGSVVQEILYDFLRNKSARQIEIGRIGACIITHETRFQTSALRGRTDGS